MTTTLYDQLERRILLLDGGFGTMVQGYGLQEEDYRGRRFAGWPVQLKGCNDLLALTRPDVVREIHEKYLRAGASKSALTRFRRPQPESHAARPTSSRPATRRSRVSWRDRWVPRTARPRCRPTYRIPRPAR